MTATVEQIVTGWGALIETPACLRFAVEEARTPAGLGPMDVAFYLSDNLGRVIDTSNPMDVERAGGLLNAYINSRTVRDYCARITGAVAQGLDPSLPPPPARPEIMFGTDTAPPVVQTSVVSDNAPAPGTTAAVTDVPSVRYRLNIDEDTAVREAPPLDAMDDARALRLGVPDMDMVRAVGTHATPESLLSALGARYVRRLLNGDRYDWVQGDFTTEATAEPYLAYGRDANAAWREIDRTASTEMNAATGGGNVYVPPGITDGTAVGFDTGNNATGGISGGTTPVPAAAASWGKWALAAVGAYLALRGG